LFLRINVGVLTTLNEIAKTTLMIHCDASCCRFDHAKSREMIYEEIPPLLRKEYHSRIAKKIEADQETEGFSINDLAFHYDEAGNKEKAVKYSLQAGQIALSRFSNVEAIKHFKYVLESIAQNPENAEARRTAQEGLGDAYYANSAFKEAMRTFEDLGKSETGTVKLRALRKAMECAFQCMDIARLMELVKEAEPYAAADRLESARVLMSRGRVYIMRHLVTLAPEDRMHALEDMRAALRVFEEEYSLWDAALALIGAGTMHPLFGEPQKGIAESLRSIALFEELGDFRFQMEACWAAGLVFEQMLLLNNEALGVLAKIIEIDEKMKMGDYNRLVYAYAFSASTHEQMGDWEGALSFSLKALEASKKTENFIAPGIVYANLCREYARLGDMKNAEEYFEKLIKLPPEVQKNILTKGELAKAVFFAGKGQWKESNQFFKDHIESFKVDQVRGDEVRGRLFYAWALERQGRLEEAKVQLEYVQKLYRDTEEMFAHVSLQANLMVPKKVEVGQIFEARLCIVNVSRGHGLLVRVENDLHPEFRVRNLPQEYTNKNEFFDEKERKLEPFQVTTLKVKLEGTKTGVFDFNLKVVYRDDLGKIRICNPEQYNITVEPESAGVGRQELIAPRSAGKPHVKTSESEKTEAGPTVILDAKFEFASEPSKMAFDYLVNAFIEDYMRRRIAQEKAGWRSLMRIITKGKLPRSSLYGYGGRRGKALIELESRGLVEARFFPGERGRGGKTLKIRVAYEKEVIKRIVDSRIMNKKNA
jgi:tetratricopeptide (TPR) repeat protein